MISLENSVSAKVRRGYFIVVLVVIIVFGIIIVRFRNNRDCRKILTAVAFDGGFISQVWPAPDSRITLICYQNSNELDPVHLERIGIGAILLSAEVDTNWERPPVVPLEDRIRLIVDGVEVNRQPWSIGYLELLADCDENLNCRDTGRPVGLSIAWLPQLSVGEHDAMLIVTDDEGNDLMYQWSFRITRY